MHRQKDETKIENGSNDLIDASGVWRMEAGEHPLPPRRRGGRSRHRHH